MSDAHGHDHHDEHALPPPEPDPINGLNVFLWGIGTFVVLIVTIALLGSYFWVERVKEDTDKVEKAGHHMVAKKAMLAEQKARLTPEKLKSAMDVVIKEYAGKAK
jgi:hypothetical protein